MDFFLPDADATGRFGMLLAAELAAGSNPPPIFFFGEMGAGKTTLISGLVKNLAGGDAAEVSSPSFTMCNIYPTTPPAAHFDLYRQTAERTDESLLDFLDAAGHVVLVEWAERMPAADVPPVRLECVLSFRGESRLAALTAFGEAARALAAHMRDMWK